MLKDRSIKPPHGAHDAHPRRHGQPPTRGGQSRLSALAARGLAIVICGCFGGCSSGLTRSGLVDQATQAGARTPSVQLPTASGALPPAVLKGSAISAQKVALRLHAGDALNTDLQGRSLSVVARVYALRDKAAFQMAPYSDFEEIRPTKTGGFANDVVAVKEMVLTPGRRYESLETFSEDAPFLAVVVLFRSPAEGRWRFVFDAKSSVPIGITLGVHSCALSVSQGQPLDAVAEPSRLVGVVCP